ncbi:Uma2 family endonuclease [Sphingomonas lenta]|nr:Uma2 family endonuclease [Sphingomonas lenta]
MASIALDPAYRRVSVEEFLRMDFGDAKAELEDGIIFMMAGGTPEHALIAARLIRHLGNALDGSGCEPVGSDMPLRTEERTMRLPDVSVYCGPIGRPEDPGRAGPVVLIEVLSPSTSDHDQKVKLLEYQALPSVREIMFIDPITGAVRAVRRSDDDGWSDRWLRGDEQLELRSLGVSLTRAELGLPD